jgi:hypothetical protein
MNKTHQINETHIGDNTTPEEAKAVVEALQKLGVDCEYTPLIGGPSYIIDEDGERVDIDQRTWDEALTVLTY